MKTIVAITFEIIPFIFFPLSCLLLYKYGESAIRYIFAFFVLCLPEMIHVGLIGNYLKKKYDDYFEYNKK